MTIEAVVLAAGLSTRSQVYKMSLPLKKKTVIEACVDGMYNKVDKITVVGGYNFHIIKDLLKDYKKVNLIYNEKYEDGMFSSVKLGINSINTNRFFLIPGDYVLVDDKVYASLLQYKNKKSIVIPTYEGKKGHPVYFTDIHVKEMVNNDEFNNLRQIINCIGFETLDIKDDGILYDIDTFQDYEIIKEKYLLKYEGRV